MSALLELAERCEQSAGPDRELDRAIELTLPGVLPHPLDGDKPAGQWANVISSEGHPDYEPGQGYSSPAYTASLDAAMTLVPEGWEFATGSGRKNSLSIKRPWGNVFAPDEIGSRAIEAATPALALCAAALRARAA